MSEVIHRGPISHWHNCRLPILQILCCIQTGGLNLTCAIFSLVSNGLASDECIRCYDLQLIADFINLCKLFHSFWFSSCLPVLQFWLTNNIFGKKQFEDIYFIWKLSLCLVASSIRKYTYRIVEPLGYANRWTKKIRSYNLFDFRICQHSIRSSMPCPWCYWTGNHPFSLIKYLILVEGNEHMRSNVSVIIAYMT